MGRAFMGARDQRARLEPGRRLSRILSGAWRPAPHPPAVSLEELEGAVELLGATGAGALAWWVLRGSELRGSTPAQRLQGFYRAQAVHSALSQEELTSALALLRAEGIEPILGKGWAVARSYPSRGLRPCGDVDLYVCREDHARGLLASRRSGLPIDLHEECPELADHPWETLFARSRTVGLDDHAVRVFGPEDQLRLVVLHFLRHGGWRPLWLCDAAVLLEAAAPPTSLRLPPDPARRREAKAMFTMNVNELLAAAGGLDEDGAVRLPQVLWKLLEGAPRALVYEADRKAVAGEIRLAPGGAGVYHLRGEGYALLSPEELEELLRTQPVGV